MDQLDSATNTYLVMIREAKGLFDCFDLIHAVDLNEAESITENKYPKAWTVVSLVHVNKK